MNKKSFNEMTYEEKVAQMDSFLDGLTGEDWDRFLMDTEYELYKNIECPFLDEDFSPVDIYNTVKSIAIMDLPLIYESKNIYNLTHEYNIGVKSESHIADNYGYKLAA
ncbi:MAG: hypothetical protein M0P73_15500 [Syntrophobacterales bacterium]|jgi:hypothetical protein|nr:hypothetical protein [Syntrophobacterales bacterium]